MVQRCEGMNGAFMPWEKENYGTCSQFEPSAFRRRTSVRKMIRKSTKKIPRFDFGDRKMTVKILLQIKKISESKMTVHCAENYI